MKSILFLIVTVVLGFSLISCSSDDKKPKVEICNNGIDDDGDGFVDCEDFDCLGSIYCAVEICDNGIDDDGDGFVDCEDLDCANFPGCQ